MRLVVFAAELHNPAFHNKHPDCKYFLRAGTLTYLLFSPVLPKDPKTMMELINGYNSNGSPTLEVTSWEIIRDN
jgi:hypothetical protein